MDTDHGVEKDSISIAFVREAIDAALCRGVEPAPLLAQAGISAAVLSSSQARVSAVSFSRLWLAVAAALDDEFFAQDSRRMKVGSFAALCQFSLNARQLRAALQLASKFLALLLDDLAVSLDEQAGIARLVVRPTPRALAQGHPPASFAYETLLVMVHGLMCWLIGMRIPLLSAHFNYARLPRWREYQPMFSENLVFDAAETALVFESRFLDAQVVQSERTARQFLRDAPHNIVVKYRNTNSWAARVRGQLRQLPPQDWPSFDRLAQRLDISPTALRRRLDHEAATFRSIKQALRRDIAIQQLTHSALPIPSIAEAVGFAEPSAFHRAFKSWTGVRPGEYRRLLAAQSGQPD